jgi:glycosyltransferase involved in cell wall biosynthesis
MGGVNVLCVFNDAPTDGSVASKRWLRLAQHVCTLGPALAIVLHDVSAPERQRLSELLGARVEVLSLPYHSRTRALARAIGRPSGAWPLTRTDAAGARASIEQRLAGSVPQLVWCAGAEAWLALPSSLRSSAVVDVIDLPSRNRRELARVAVHRLGRRIARDGGVDASAFGMLRDVDGAVRSRWLERHVARHARAVVVANPAEAVGQHGLVCVPNGVDDPGRVPEIDDRYPTPHFVFPGSFLYPPHQDAAEWFALFVLPPLRRLAPTCRVVFAGDCPDWMYEFGRLHDIDITGPIADFGLVLDGTSVVIAPIRAGSGTTIEIVDAWARGIPVVSTSRGVEGLDAHDGDDVLIADDPAEFAARCSMVARLPELRARLVERGRARYEAEFTWDEIGHELRNWLTQSAS